MSKSITLGGGNKATVLYVSEKRKKKYLLKIYSVKGCGIQKGRIPRTELDEPSKDRLLFKLKFKNRGSIERLITILSVMRDKSIFAEGVEAVNQYRKKKQFIASLTTDEIKEMTELLTDEAKNRLPKEEKTEEKQPQAVSEQ